MADNLASAFSGSVYPPMQPTPERTNQALLRETERRRQLELEQQRESDRGIALGAMNRPDTLTAGPQKPWREGLADIAGTLGGAVTGYEPRDISEKTQELMTAGDFTPYVGDALGVVDTLSDVFQGNWNSAGVNLIGAAAPLVSGHQVAKGLKEADEPGGIRKIANKVLGNVEDVPPEKFAFKGAGADVTAPVELPPEDYTPGIADDLAAATVPADPRAGAYQAVPQPPPVTAPASTKFTRTYDPEAFHAAIGAAKQGKFGPAVEQKSLEDYGGDMIMYLSEDGKSGFAVKPDGDLVSVFSTEKGRLKDIMDKGKLVGASKLDAFDLAEQPLPKIYGKYGFEEVGDRMKWDEQYRPPDWQDELGKPDIANMKYDQPAPQPPGPRQQVEGQWGNKDRPDVKFEGAEPSQFTPEQWFRFGKQYGSPVPLGPENETAWYASLKPVPGLDGKPLIGANGQPVLIPGGMMSKEPFTYWDDLFIKSQGIDPNKLDVATRGAIHDRMVAGKMPPEGGHTDAQIFNQLLFGLSSPSNPLTKNMFAAVMAGAKGPEDLKRIAESSGMDFRLSSNVVGTQSAPAVKGMPGTPYTPEARREASKAITDATGIGAGARGGLGVSGNLDYTLASDLAQMMREKPEYFRFKGAGEGGSTPAEHWSNFIDRLITQVPGLKAKTGSFGGVWQDPVHAATSAVDRHIMNVTGDKMFETPKAAEAWRKSMVKTWNADAKKWNKANPKQRPRPTDLTTVEQVSASRGGADFLTEERFKLVNNPRETNIRESKTEQGGISPDVPEHLRPDVADYPVEPQKSVEMSEDYKRVMNTVAGSAARPGSTGLFSDQWFIWDPARSRLEPHEIRNPGLESLPRMSEKQAGESYAAHGEAGYLAGGKPKPVGQAMFAEGDTPQVGPTNEVARQRLHELLGGLNPSRLALFQYLAASLGGSAAAYEWLSQQKQEEGT